MAPKTTAKDCTKRLGKAKQLLSLLKTKVMKEEVTVSSCLLGFQKMLAKKDKERQQ